MSTHLARIARDPGRSVQIAVAAVAVATVAVGLTLSATGVVLGTPLAPFLSAWDPAVNPLAVVSVAALAAGVALAPALLRPRVRPTAFAGAAFLLALGLAVCVNLGREGTAGLSSAFSGSFEAKNEYLPALPALDLGVRWFLDRFAELVPSLPVHAAGHPPGMLVLLHSLGIRTAGGMAALVTAAGALSAPLTYVLGRELLDEPRARLAALLFAFSPAPLLFGAASADALYATLALAATVGLLARPATARAAGAVGLAAASFFSYALLAAGPFAVICVARREGLRRAALLAAGAGLALVAFYAVLHAATGFDPIGAVDATESVYRFSLARVRPYAFWLFGSPVAYLVTAGLPLLWFAARSLGRREASALALAAVIGVAAVIGFTKAETERIWLFLVPALCVAAAASLPRGRLRPVLGLLAVQALATELLLGTVW